MENSDDFEVSSDYKCIFEISINEIYLIALKFFKENKDKAFHMNYQNKIKMTALSYHIKHGSLDMNSMPEIGMFDFVGKDIRRQWQTIETLSKDLAQQQFIDLLKSCCPEFNGFLEAKVKQAEIEALEKHEKIEIEKEKLKLQEEKLAQDNAFKLALQLENQKRIDEENKLRSILNQQTFPQFHNYAVQQHPNDVKAQEQLIAQLQQHHFHQYMLAIYERSKGVNEVNGDVSNESNNFDSESESPENLNGDNAVENEIKENGYGTEHEVVSSYSPGMVEICCESSINEFKASFQAEPESVMKIGSGEVVTIRVPSSSTNSFLIWQFATDECDIGFGVSVSNEMSGQTNNNIEIVPVLRRDSHKQVYCGRIKLLKDCDGSDQMFFLLRFDNSYSLWRHKWLYYRVCYAD